jgi:hypothetical protein
LSGETDGPGQEETIGGHEMPPLIPTTNMTTRNATRMNRAVTFPMARLLPDASLSLTERGVAVSHPCRHEPCRPADT